MTTETMQSLRLTRLIKADRETVFKAWTDPAQLTKWACPEGVELEAVEVDLRLGGKHQLKMKSPEGEFFNMNGVYTVIEPPAKLAYTWRWLEEAHDCGETLVTVEFNQVGDNTEVVVTHDRFPNPEAKQGHDEGWNSCLDKLEALLA